MFFTKKGGTMKVVLINPYNHEETTSWASSQSVGSIFHPDGLWLIRATVLNKVPDVEVVIFDEGLHQYPTDEDLTQADIVGISTQFSGVYPKAMDYAKRIKNLNPAIRVVLGGAHATPLVEQILRRQNCFDFVCRNDGSLAITQLVSGIPIEQIPNLSYREDDCVIHNKPDRGSSLMKISGYYPDIPWQLYWDNCKALDVPNFVGKVFFSGCEFRRRMKQVIGETEFKGCEFCFNESALDDAQSPEMYWRDRMSIQKACCDSFTLRDYTNTWTLGMLRSAWETKPKDLELPRQHVYIRATDVGYETVKLLKEMNTKQVFIGFESNSNAQLKVIAKGSSQTANFRAMEICAQAGIRIYPSFILGTMNETVESVSETISFVKRLIQSGLVEVANCSILCPTPGTAYYARLIQVEPWIGESDYVELDTLRLLWLKHFCPKLPGKTPERKKEFLKQQINNALIGVRKNAFALKL